MKIEYSSKSQAENGVDNTTIMTPLRVKQSILANSSSSPGSTDYNDLTNKPRINNVELTGNKTAQDLGIKENVQADWNESDTTAGAYINNKPTIPTNISDLNNDSDFVRDVSTSTPGGYLKLTRVNNNTELAFINNGVPQILQNELVSGQNIKTINNQSLLGSGNINIGGGGTATDVQINSQSITSSGVADIKTKGTYNASTNKIVTESDLPTITSSLTNDGDGRLPGVYDGYAITNTPGNGLNVSYNSSTRKTTVKPIYQWSTVNDTLAYVSDIPTATSELTNDSDFVSDASYVHTDNNYTTLEQTKLSGIEAGAEVNVQADWNETSTSSDAYINNKPTIPTVPTNVSAFTNDAGYLTSETDPIYSASAASTITSQDITAWSAAEANVIEEVQVDGTPLTVTNKSVNITGKQDTLVSGTNIKTINNQSLLGSGNINIGGGGGTATDVQVNGSSITVNDVANIVTESAYNSSTNKIATMADVPNDLDDLGDPPTRFGVTPDVGLGYTTGLGYVMTPNVSDNFMIDVVTVYTGDLVSGGTKDVIVPAADATKQKTITYTDSAGNTHSVVVEYRATVLAGWRALGARSSFINVYGAAIKNDDYRAQVTIRNTHTSSALVNKDTRIDFHILYMAYRIVP